MARYIDADALAYIVASNGDADFINKVTRLMIEAPSIDIEPKRGEWIYVTVEEGLRTGRGYGHHCSECDEINRSGSSNFCPNCGADMRGADDE